DSGQGLLSQSGSANRNATRDDERLASLAGCDALLVSVKAKQSQNFQMTMLLVIEAGTMTEVAEELRKITLLSCPICGLTNTPTHGFGATTRPTFGRRAVCGFFRWSDAGLEVRFELGIGEKGRRRGGW